MAAPNGDGTGPLERSQPEPRVPRTTAAAPRVTLVPATPET